MIKLKDINEKDFQQIINSIPDARFLLQWAGIEYTYPLDNTQLKKSLEKPTIKMFKAIESNTSESIGHIQLLKIDYDNLSCVLGRVLIFFEFRNNGLSKELVNCAINYVFIKLGLNEITLNVFDFNKSAISTYKKVGFVEYEFIENARQFQNENWNLIKMKLYKDDWICKNANKTQEEEQV